MTPNIIPYRKEFLAGLVGLGGGPTGVALGGAVAKKTYIEDLFSNYLWRGNAGAQVINNGIALGSSGAGNSIDLSDTTQNERLTRTSALSGVSAGKTFTLSAWVFIPNTGVYGQLFYVDNGSQKRFELGFGNYIQIAAWNSSNSKFLDVYTPSNVPITPGTWNHLLVSMDLTDTSKRHVYVNDSNVSMTYGSYGNQDILFNLDYVSIFGQDDTSQKLFGNLSNFYFDQTYRDLGTTANRRLFYAADGTPATGQASLSPVIYYPFSTLSTTNAGSGGDFTFQDSPTLSEFGPYKDSSGDNGGLVISKNRTSAGTEWAWGSETLGNNKYIDSNSISNLQTSSAYRSFNTNGFTIGSSSVTNQNNNDFVNYSFKKQEGFVDIVTFVGNGSTPRNIAHNLGSVPGWIVIMCTTKSENKTCWHRGLDAGDSIYIDAPNGASNIGAYPAQPTGTQFTIGSYNNLDGETYVAWIFAGGESPAATARSVEFDGSGDYLSMSDSDNAPGTGSFTFECWFKPTSIATDSFIFDSRSATNQSDGFGIQVGTGGNISVKVGSGSWISSGPYGFADPGRFYKNQWHHIAIVWDGSVANCYFNGIKGYKSTTGYNFTSGSVKIGANAGNAEEFSGYISNLRLTKGQVLYTKDFKVTTEPLTTTSQGATASNVKILCCNNASVTGKTTGGTITANGGPTASSDSPFDDPEGFQFGDKGDQNAIKCGNYTTDGSEDAGVYLGWEPQMVIIKRTDSSTGGSWLIYDRMRGMTTVGPTAYDSCLSLELDDGAAESTNARIKTTTTGFYQDAYGANRDYMYIAIRRADGYVSKPAKVGTDLFAIDAGNNAASYPVYISGFPVDLGITKQQVQTKDWEIAARMTAYYWYKTPALASKQSGGSSYSFDYQNGWGEQPGEDDDYMSWMWQRRGQGFDIVSYQGQSGTYAPMAVSHNLAQPPEMLWIKDRDNSTEWAVGADGMTDWNQYMKLNTNDGELYGASTFGAAPTATHFTVGTASRTNGNNNWYLAILFASVSGISKCGSYSGSSTTITVTTGFQPRFIIIKRVDSGGSWLTWDTVRGWVAGNNNKSLAFNSASAHTTANGYTGGPISTGFTLNSNADYNGNGGTYLYYAHA